MGVLGCGVGRGWVGYRLWLITALRFGGYTILSLEALKARRSWVFIDIDEHLSWCIKITPSMLRTASVNNQEKQSTARLFSLNFLSMSSVKEYSMLPFLHQQNSKFHA